MRRMRRGRAADWRRWIASRKFSRARVPTHGTSGLRQTSSRRTSSARSAAARSSSRKKTSSTCGSIRARRKPPCSPCVPELKWPADAYLEAVEQARGWFSSSLVCAVSERGTAPFKSIISHGLTIDEKGRKMSKSLGNSEDAVDAAGRMGADVLRLVYASLDYTADITLGQTIFNAVSESYRKIRNTCRFVLGNLADFDPARDAVRIEGHARVRSLHPRAHRETQEPKCAALTKRSSSRPRSRRCRILSSSI